MATRRPGRPVRVQSREAMVAAARLCFAQSGFGGATVDAIAMRLDIRKPSLLHHFHSKEALYAAAVGSLLAELGELFTAAVRGGPFGEELDTLGLRLTEYLAHHPDAAALLLRELGSAGGHPSIVAADELLRATAEFLRSGVDQGAIPEQDVAQLTMSILGLHLVWFAAPGVTGRLIGDAITSPAETARRAAWVRMHVRRLCGMVEPPSAVPG